MVPFFLLHPHIRLRQGLAPQGPVKPFSEGVVKLQHFFRWLKGLAVQCVCKAVQEKDIGFAHLICKGLRQRSADSRKVHGLHRGKEGFRSVFGWQKMQKQTVVSVNVTVHHRPSVPEKDGQLFCLSRKRVPYFRLPLPLYPDFHMLRVVQGTPVPHLLLTRFHALVGLGYEEPAVPFLLTHLIQQILCPRFPVFKEIHFAPGFQRFQQALPRQGKAAAPLNQAV